LRFAPPANINSLLRSLENKNPKQALETSAGWHLERMVFDDLNAKYGKRDAAIHIEKLLTELPTQLPSLAERAYLEETLRCLRVKSRHFGH
jgi:hypothetical protein